MHLANGHSRKTRRRHERAACELAVQSRYIHAGPVGILPVFMRGLVLTASSEYGKDIRTALETFRSTLLSDDTSVGLIATGVDGTSKFSRSFPWIPLRSIGVDEYILNENQLALTLQANREHPHPYEF
jgi:hypothetical protein